MNLYPLLEMLLAPILMGAYCTLLILDDRTPEDDTVANRRLEFLWHLVGGVIFAYFAYLYASKYGWHTIAYTLANFWLIFAGIVHKWALRKPVFYVGTVAVTDRAIRRVHGITVSLMDRIKFIGQKRPSVETVCAVLKIAAYFAAAALYMIQ